MSIIEEITTSEVSGDPLEQLLRGEAEAQEEISVFEGMLSAAEIAEYVRNRGMQLAEVM